MSALDIISIVLDGQPMILFHLPMLNSLPAEVDWHWWIVEGAAANTNCTKWCKPQLPRLSRDGTTEYLNSLRYHPRATILQREMWPGGKVEMVNAATTAINRKTVLLQMDADECWTADQLQRMLAIFAEQPEIHWMRFFCQYFVGPNIVITSENGYGNRPSEWLRAWKFTPGMKWKTHEPPLLGDIRKWGLTREQTRKLGFRFDHFAYAFEPHVAYKEAWYGYKGAVGAWRRLQENTQWPCSDLRMFLPWVGPNVTADRLCK